MALAIRMSRGGRKAAPFYRIVVADSRNARDGSYLERLGTYDPRLPSDNPARVVLKEDRLKHWLSVGAQPSERVALFLGKAGIIEMPKYAARPQKSAPKAKAQERLKEQEAAAQAKIEAAEAAKAEAAAAAEQAKIDAAAAAAAPAEAVAADPVVEEAVADASAAPAAPAEESAEAPKAE